MSEESKATASASVESPGAPASPRKRPLWLPAAVLLGVFLMGFLPMWLKSSTLTRELDDAGRQARLAELQITLANAAIDTRRGDYEHARLSTANFFNLITTELDRTQGSALPDNARSDLQPILAQRDELITLLARADPASAERLTIFYTSFRKMLGK